MIHFEPLYWVSSTSNWNVTIRYQFEVSGHYLPIRTIKNHETKATTSSFILEPGAGRSSTAAIYACWSSRPSIPIDLRVINLCERRHGVRITDTQTPVIRMRLEVFGVSPDEFRTSALVTVHVTVIKFSKFAALQDEMQLYGHKNLGSYPASCR